MDITAELAGMLARFGELTDAATADDTADDQVIDAARIDAIGLLERIQAAAAATQAALSVRFGRSQVQTQHKQLLRDPRAVGRGIGDQLALACGISPTEGSRRLGIARALHTDLPATAALLRDGQISFYVAGLVVTETRHLDPDHRRPSTPRSPPGSPGARPGRPPPSPAATPTPPTPPATSPAAAPPAPTAGSPCAPPRTP